MSNKPRCHMCQHIKGERKLGLSGAQTADPRRVLESGVKKKSCVCNCHESR